MGKIVHKPLAKICCYLLAVAVMCVPLAHGAMMSSIDSNHAHTVDVNSADHSHGKSHTGETESQPCHSTPMDVDNSVGATNLKFNDVDCGHDKNLSCKTLCAGSAVTIPETTTGPLPQKSTDTWLAVNTAQVYPPASAPLFKPPRA